MDAANAERPYDGAVQRHVRPLAHRPHAWHCYVLCCVAAVVLAACWMCVYEVTKHPSDIFIERFREGDFAGACQAAKATAAWELKQGNLDSQEGSLHVVAKTCAMVPGAGDVAGVASSRS